ncbi:MAG: hypothetical protein H6704_03090 [Myxococcales bacterium]|nr:hypothetical protein [Myxococcales bacterium]
MGQLTGAPDGEAGQGALLRGLAGVAVALGAVDVAGEGPNVTLRRRPGVAPDAAAVGAWLDAFCAGGAAWGRRRSPARGCPRWRRRWRR